MTINNHNEELDQTTDHQTSTCVCGRQIREREAVLMYYNHGSGDQVIAGPLCPTCQQDIELLLGAGRREKCDHCCTPLSVTRHGVVRELNEEGHLEDIRTLCSPCLKDRYS